MHKRRKKLWIKVEVDLLGVADCVSRSIAVEKWGADFIGVHTAIDEQMQGRSPFEKLKEICSQVSIPVAVAGGINSETVVDAVNAGAKIVIVGGAICKATDIKTATKKLKNAISTREKVAEEFFKRTSGDDVREILEKVSTGKYIRWQPPSERDHRNKLHKFRIEDDRTGSDRSNVSW